MKRARLLSVVAIILGGVIGLISSTQTWLNVVLTDGAHDALAVAGATAIPLIAPLSLAAMAAGLTLTIVGKVLRYIIGVLAVAIGVTLFVLTLGVVTEPSTHHVAAAITETTGLSGTTVISGMITSLTVTPWPVVALVAWVAVAIGGALTLATAHTWLASGKKYATTKAKKHEGPLDKIDSWDELSRGEDPTQSA